jgi:uncharacterized membrane protein
MITAPIFYLLSLILICGVIVFIERKSQYKIFNYLPSFVLIYILIMILATLGLWQSNSEITTLYKETKSLILPILIFLLMLQLDLKLVLQLTPKVLLSFFLASFSLILAFIVTYTLFQNALPQDAWKSFTALSGSWMGGTANMVAVAQAINTDEVSMGYTLIMDTVNYSVWVAFLLAIVPFSVHFNHFTKAKNTLSITPQITLENSSFRLQFRDYGYLILLIIVAYLVSDIITRVSIYLPTSDYFTLNSWQIILITLAGITASFTPLRKVSGSSTVANILLYLLIALIASRANISEFDKVPLFIIAGFVILGFHAILMLLFAKLFKLDLFSCAVASLANIGGIASAPILASSYSKALVPIAILLATLGYVIGTFAALFLGSILKGIA